MMWYSTIDPMNMAIVESYCLGKGKLFQMFWGWRYTASDGRRVYRLPPKAVRELGKIMQEVHPKAKL